VNIFNFQSRKTLKLFLLITISHFVITTTVGYFVGKKIGEQTRPVFKEFFGKLFSENTKSSDAEELVSITQTKIKVISDSWKPITSIISFPIINVLDPHVEDVRHGWLRGPVKTEEMPPEQYLRRNHILQLAIYLLNSIAFGLIVFGIYKLIQQIKISRHSHII